MAVTSVGRWMKLKYKGEWVSLYRAIDKNGDTLEFMLSTT